MSRELYRGETDPEVMEFEPSSGTFRTVRPRVAIPGKHIILFLLTILSTILVGGIAYSVSIIAILLTHEMGHYLMARRYGIPATLPYFIPFPLNFFGTMGAVIKMDGRWATRKQLFDIGVAGPLAGVVVAIPIALIGLHFSEVVYDMPAGSDMVTLGDSLLFKFLTWMVKGSLGEESVVMLHPIALAGWVGLFVTALNLLPVGQLDGGHILYGLFGRGAARLSLLVFSVLALFALLKSPGWLLLVLLIFYFGYRHPPAREEEIELDTRRRWIGAITLLLFVLAFAPVPISTSLP